MRIRDHVRLISALTLVSMLAGCGGEDGADNAAAGDASPASTPAARSDATPNVVLISIDTLRPDHLGCYGYGRATSPRIDQLAAEGALFEHTVSSTSWTLPAHCALFTGLSDTVHGCTDTDRQLDPSRTTLAERFSDAGYATVGFFAGPYLHPIFGLAQGFDRYIDCCSYADTSLATAAETGTIDTTDIMRRSHQDITNPTVYGEVHRWLTERRDESFFMFIHLWDVHFDFIPPEPYNSMFDPDYEGWVTGENFFFDPRINRNMNPRDLRHLIALYDGEIAWTDHHVGMILDDLDELGLTGSTIVMLVADHGTEFFEHRDKGHRQTLFDEVIHIPMIVRYPGHVPAGRRFAEQTRIIDVHPTILDLAGLGPTKNVMGQSLEPLMNGGSLEVDNLAISELYCLDKRLRSYRRNDRKLIYRDQRNEAYAFRLDLDPGEQRPVTPPNPQIPWIAALLDDERQAKDMLTHFRSLLPESTASPELTDEIRRKLQSLGYVGSEDEENDAEGGEAPPPDPDDEQKRP